MIGPYSSAVRVRLTSSARLRAFAPRLPMELSARLAGRREEERRGEFGLKRNRIEAKV